MTVLIRGEGLSKNYGSKRALDNVSFEISKGAPVALVGPNGAGKTTLFSLLCGYILPSAGSLSVMGHKPGSAALFGKLTALPQDAQLDPRFSIAHQLNFYGQLQGLSNAVRNKETARVLELVGLAEVAKHRPDDLSHGMRKRVTIAQALIGTPEIVMLDEATAGLDPIHAREVRELVSTLSNEATFILSSHDLTELERLCSQVLHLDQGVLSEHQARSTSQDNKHYITLQLSQLYDGVETKLSSLPEVNHVYMSQSKEYVIEFEKGADPFDINLLHFCYQQGWHYRQLVNGHTLENQIFNKES
ncbi:ABC transporter ATP-binding protein [Pseudoalteromonas lipolytica]|uniref:ABC transporter ATP-binding protein n=1 Tax=Pseudoalteromonas lipolytica TaxID=570156 RepID=A0AAD0RYL9_9GAMM|nr:MULTISPECIES: ABC transporter ATP-binding protein [Pseudoalteromonas]AXV64970.1 ABC transporter ATP-binding protein [Pseudoalteromonas donghaensis]QPL44060.1 ABC transporter ATP-binding protein [Pseudoalteromonas sp. A41-2]